SFSSENEVVLNENYKNYDLGKNIYFYEDKSNSLKIIDFTKKDSKVQNKFKLSKKVIPSFGYSDSSFWFKLNLNHEKSPQSSWILSVEYLTLDFVTFYKLENKEWKKYEMGDQITFGKRKVKQREFALQITPKNKRETIYIKIKTAGPLEVPIKLYNSQYFSDYKSSLNYGMGIYFGCLLAMVLYNLILYISTKQINYLYYVTFLFFFTFFLSTLEGYSFKFIFKNYPWFNNNGLALSINISALFFLIFCKNYLSIKGTKFQRLNKTFKFIERGYVIGFILSFFLPYSVVLRFSIILSIIGLSTLVYSGYIRFKEGYKPATYFLFAFSLFIIGTLLRLLSALNILSASPFYKYSFHVGVALQAILLAIGLADIINSLLEEKIEAEVKLFEANRDLEEKVKLRTQDLSIALKDIEYLLNNMKQAIFTINEEGEIMGPVSAFSKEIFEQDIEGKNINETLFKSYDSGHQIVSAFNFNMACSFGNDIVQWKAIQDSNPDKVRVLTENREEKSLRLSITPLWGKDKLLQKVMLVIEDVTEIELLEKEMKKKDAESQKNIQILNQLANLKKEDLELYFSGSFKNVSGLISSSNKIKDNIHNGVTFLNEMNVLLRELHTIKGNARVFGFNFISDFAHELEAKVEKKYNIHEDKNDITISFLEDMISDFYELQSVIYLYLTPSKNLFHLGLYSERNIIQDIHQKFIDINLNFYLFLNSLEFKSKLSTFSLKKESESDNLAYYEKLKEQLFETKSLLRFIDKKRNSEVFKSLYDDFKSLSLENSSIPIEFIKNNLIRKLKEASIDIANLYFNSSLFKPTRIDDEFFVQFSKFFLDINYKLISKKNDRASKLDIINMLSNIPLQNHYIFLDDYFKLSKNILDLKDDGEIERQLIFLSQDIWSFLSLILKIDLNKKIKRKEKVKIIEKINTDEEFDYELLPDNSLLKNLLKSSNQEFKDRVNKEMEIIYGPKTNFLNTTIPTDIEGEGIQDILEDIKNKKIPLLFERIKDNALIEDPIFLKINKLLFKNNIHYPSYNKILSFLYFMISFFEDSVNKFTSKPKTIEVLEENYLKLESALSSLSTIKDQNEKANLEEAFQSLSYISLNYQIQKLGDSVNDMAKKLGKQIEFKVSGDEVSLSKRNINALQDVFTHIFRNSIDHGIETPEERLRSFKNETGNISVKIEKKEKNNIYLIIKDDGRGFDINKIKNKAIEKNLLTKGEAEGMTDDQIISFIFSPSFSTKEEVSEISGRGVGMDVVKTFLEEISSEISVSNRKSNGAKFLIKLNLN
ncbi:MAG: hypothetical protein CME68_09470, partial [Halobacteriovoraceae bacterium]|nr:hypothetical protein [Halobacteriovoraceae bacterium]